MCCFLRHHIQDCTDAFHPSTALKGSYRWQIYRHSRYTLLSFLLSFPFSLHSSVRRLHAPSHTSSHVIFPPRCLMVPALSAVKLKDSVVSTRSPPRPIVNLKWVEELGFLSTRDDRRSTFGVNVELEWRDG